MASRPEISLKALEVFRACARFGSLMGAAKAMAISTSTAAHHLAVLESHLGVELLDRNKKPLSLTTAGMAFLADLEPALAALRKAAANANPQAMQLGRQFRFGTIEDFETDIVPELAVFMNHKFPSMDFSYHIETSLELLEMMQNRALDMSISTKPSGPIANLSYTPLVQDPFVIVAPKHCTLEATQLLDGGTDLPFLRFQDSQMIGQQIEAQLKRLKIKLPKRMSIGNNAILMALVAADSGWAITTALLYARSKHSHKDLRLLEFPRHRFTREVGLFWTSDCPTQLAQMAQTKICKLIERYALEPVHQAYPWLEDQFTI